MRHSPGPPAQPGLPFVEPRADPLRARVRELEAEREQLLEHVFHLQRVAQAGLMTSGLAHDLANQATGLLGHAELALMRAHPDALREGLRTVLEHGCRMHDTVDAFVSFVRRREHRVRPVPVQDLLAGVQRLLDPVARAQSVAVLATCATGASLRADRQLVEQALVNLGVNAIRAAGEGAGRVVLSACDSPSGRVRLSVRDTGRGIAECVRSRLFEPFVTSRPDDGGTGLGLYVVRQIVERLGGRVSVESSAAGTRIDLDLPAWNEAARDPLPAPDGE